MTPKVLNEIWTAIGPALGDHLWQSTIMAGIAAAMAVLLRHNHARTRFWIWLLASVKFLLPFSVLVALGNYFAWSSPGRNSTAGVYLVEEISRPFAPSSAAPAVVSAAGWAALIHLLPAALAILWLCGFVGVLGVWWMRWRRVGRDLAVAAEIREGREVECLRRLERAAGIRQAIAIKISRSTLEPGIFGLRHPVLVWPEGISERLDDAQLEAVIAHELWHVRRRDNCTAAVHMLVEAIFWFHPLVWWLGARLVDERERACDEEVIGSGSQRQTYAESILKVCEFCVGSPLPCVSGVTGADLKKRMVRIMSEHVVQKLDFTRRFLLSAVAAAVIAAPIAFGLLHATPSRAQDNSGSPNDAVVESASIKPSELNTPTYAGTKQHMIRMMYGPDGFDARNVTLRALIQEAYQVQANQIEGPSDFLDSSAFDVEVKLATSNPDRPPSKRQMERVRQALQKLLAEHAGLVLHSETKALPIYALEVAEGGAKLQPTPSSDEDEMKGSGPGHIGTQQMRMKMGGGDQVYGIAAQGISADELAQQLSRQLGTPVVNKTGLQGRYNFNLNWRDGKTSSTDGESSAEGSGVPSIFTAVQQQLGLKLQAQNAPMQVLVIEHVEKPADN